VRRGSTLRLCDQAAEVAVRTVIASGSGDGQQSDHETDELNEAIAGKVAELNARPFRGEPTCRGELFAELCRPAGKPSLSNKMRPNCCGDPRLNSSPAIAYLPAAGSWFSYFTPVPRARYNVSASWYDSGVETSSPPSSGSCQGSYQAGTRIDSAMNADLDSPQQGVIKVGRTAKFLLYVDGPDNLQIVTCDANNVEVLYDTVAYDIYSGVLELSLPVRQLRRAGRRIVLPIDVRYSQRLPSNGDQGSDAGASTTGRSCLSASRKSISRCREPGMRRLVSRPASC